MWLMKVLGHLEMGVYLIAFRVLSIGKAAAGLLEVAGWLAERLPSGWSTDQDRSVRWGRAAAHRMSRFVPGATCLHRALGTRVWLGRRGVDAEVVVGFRKGQALEGHAWLEYLAEDTSRQLFSEEGTDQFREVFRG